MGINDITAVYIFEHCDCCASSNLLKSIVRVWDIQPNSNAVYNSRRRPVHIPVCVQEPNVHKVYIHRLSDLVVRNRGGQRDRRSHHKQVKPSSYKRALNHFFYFQWKVCHVKCNILPIMKLRSFILPIVKVRNLIMGKMKVRTLILALSNDWKSLLRRKIQESKSSKIQKMWNIKIQ